ncbi:hypothetical protein AB0D38_34110 [Streptomyces sp. NPDC048279]|uniref:hypothetical protein n=1 Tax=Streptomyces sp. NPDC048279 TaxID=3154714 RepID=UPI00343E4DF9
MTEGRCDTGELAGMELELGYDLLGSRLRSIGDVPVTYGRWGGRPHALGPHPLEYDMLGSRLRWIGDIEIGYGRLGTVPRTFGTWDVDCAAWSGIPRSVGPYAVQHPRLSGRAKAVGPLVLSYDALGTRPRRVALPKDLSALPDDLLRVLFLVLYLQAERNKKASAAS